MARTNEDRFAGRVALVTGGSSGIGAATVRRLMAEGARVASIDVGGEPPEGALQLAADVSGPRRSRRRWRARWRRSVRSTSLSARRGTPARRSPPSTYVTDDEWRRVMAIDADGVFYCNRAVLPEMLERGYGRIVNISSIAGKEGNPMAAAYPAAKAAVIAMTKAIGKDVARTGVLVNCIAPAVIETPMLGGMADYHIDYMVERIPMGRMGSADEVAALACWLASDECSFSTGATYDISGGRAVY